MCAAQQAGRPSRTAARRSTTADTRAVPHRQRAGAAVPGHHRHLRVGRLGDVARPGLVLDDLRAADDRRLRADRRWRSRSSCSPLVDRAQAVAGSLLTPRHFHDLGKLMLAFVMLWAYLVVLAVPDHLVGQPAGRDSLVPRAAHAAPGASSRSRWSLGHFVLPFLLLLSQDLKKRSATARQGRACSSW